MSVSSSICAFVFFLSWSEFVLPLSPLVPTGDSVTTRWMIGFGASDSAFGLKIITSPVLTCPRPQTNIMSPLLNPFFNGKFSKSDFSIPLFSYQAALRCHQFSKSESWYIEQDSTITRGNSLPVANVSSGKNTNFISTIRSARETIHESQVSWFKKRQKRLTMLCFFSVGFCGRLFGILT